MPWPDRHGLSRRHSHIPPSTDHVQILASIPSRHFQNTRSTMIAHTKKVWCWSQANNAALKEAIKDANWDEFYEATSVNKAWQRWKSILLPLAENHIPQRSSSSTIPPKPWITAEIRAQIREKHRLYRRYKKKRCPEAWGKYRQVSRRIRWSPSPRMPHTLGEIFTHAQLRVLDFKNRNSWAGPGAASIVALARRRRSTRAQRPDLSSHRCCKLRLKLLLF